ncbi:MAG: glycosyltransferase family 4 protein [Lachnospiraceae bacterium]
MKIVFLFDSTYPYYTGGIETWIYNVCERMADKHEITIFNVKNFRKDDSMGSYHDINKKVKFISSKNLNHIPIIAPFVRSYLALLNSNITVHAMRKNFKCWIDAKEKCYVISLGTVFAAKTARLLKKEFPNIVSIVSCRSLHPEVLGESYPGVKNIALRLEKKNLEAADLIWSNGEDTYEALRSKGFLSTIIRNGIDVNKLNNIKAYDFAQMGLEGKKVIVTIGTVQKIKGYYELIDAIEILKKKYGFELHLVGIGKGNIERFYRYAEKKEVREYIHFTGEKREVISYAKAADLVACLSGGSGYGMAALESMLSKRPVIAWNSPVYRQLIENEKTGYLVKAWDAEALAEKIYNSWGTITKKSEIGEKAYESVQKFDWSYVIADIENSLKQI